MFCFFSWWRQAEREVGGGGRRVDDRHVSFAGYRSLDSKLLNDRKNGIVPPAPFILNGYEIGDHGHGTEAGCPWWALESRSGRLRGRGSGGPKLPSRSGPRAQWQISYTEPSYICKQKKQVSRPARKSAQLALLELLARSGLWRSSAPLSFP